MNFDKISDDDLKKHYIDLIEYMDKLLDVIQATRDKYVECDEKIKTLEEEIKKRKIDFREDE